MQDAGAPDLTLMTAVAVGEPDPEIIALEVHPADGGQSYLLVIQVMPTQLRGDRS